MTDELLIKFLLKETSDTESTEVQKWISESETNLLHYKQFEKVWILSKSLASDSKVDVDEAWYKFKLKAQQPEPIVTAMKPRISWLKIAAVFVAVLGSWLAYNLLTPIRYQDIVATNAVKREKLPDGSELTINKHSAISYAADFENNRHLKLEQGSVFFEVVHDKSRPFVIDIEEVAVTVVGTSFHIKHLEGYTEVIVETGIVRVRRNDEELELRKGEKVQISQASNELVKTTNADKLYKYYHSQIFVAEGSPLGKLISTLNEAYGTDVRLEDKRSIAEPVYTTLKEADGLMKNIELICKSFNLQWKQQGDQILLSPIK